MFYRLTYIISLIVISLVAIITKPLWLGTKTEIIISGLLILFAGVPHGSLDHLVAKQSRQNTSLSKYIIAYIGSATLFLLLWLWLPGLAFLFFILLTAWHFGETDFVVFSFKNNNPFIIFLYGTCLTFWLLWQNSTILEEWTAIMTSKSLLAQKFVSTIAKVPNVIWIIIVGAITLLNTNKFKQGLLERILFLFFIYLVSQTSLLIGFTLYFTGWHSLNALSHLHKMVFKNMGLKNMLKRSIPITVLSFIFLFLIVWLGSNTWLAEHALPALLVLLSILTLPHMTEMHKLYIKKK